MRPAAVEGGGGAGWDEEGGGRVAPFDLVFPPACPRSSSQLPALTPIPSERVWCGMGKSLAASRSRESVRTFLLFACLPFPLCACLLAISPPSPVSVRC